MSWLAVILGYLIGSIPTAYIFSRAMAGEDIRTLGDANMGAANIFRTFGARAGIAVFVLDLAKGVLAMLLARAMHVPLLAEMATGLAVVVGHNWPVFLGFRGGRGESTAIGVLLVIITIPTAITLVVALIVLAVKKNVILSSAVGFVPISLLGWLFNTLWPALDYTWPVLVYSIFIPVVVGITHFLRTRKQAAVQ